MADSEKIFVGNLKMEQGQYGNYFSVGFTTEHLQTMAAQLGATGWVNCYIQQSQGGKWYMTVKPAQAAAPQQGFQQQPAQGNFQQQPAQVPAQNQFGQPMTIAPAPGTPIQQPTQQAPPPQQAPPAPANGDIFGGKG